MAIQVGDAAPLFSGVAHNGETVRLEDFRHRSTVVVYFYPQDGTPHCTTQACAFRDAYEDFVQAGAIVIGISSDSNERHRDFVEQRQLPFLLLPDPDKSLRKAFGVPKTLGIFPGRVTYVIDREGIVRHIFNSQMNPTQHITEALNVVRQLAKEASGSGN